jgi:DNA invertase Pin-like site-specific DNA recombinase
MASQQVGYVRIPVTGSEAPTAQLEGIRVDRTFVDEASVASSERPQLQEALRYLREGDTLIVDSMDRLARNLADLLRVIEGLIGRGVSVRFVKEAQAYTPERSGEASNDMLQMLRAVAQFERALTRERQREGIAIAKQMPGKYKGRAPALTTEQIQELRSRDAARGGKGRAALAREFGISRQTLYSYLDSSPY